MTTITTSTRITRFSLPAEPSASSVLRRFIREIARGTRLTQDEITRLQVSVTEAFISAIGNRNSGDGRVVLEVDACDDEIKVDVSYMNSQSTSGQICSRS